jgi:hypothetical protein
MTSAEESNGGEEPIRQVEPLERLLRVVSIPGKQHFFALLSHELANLRISIDAETGDNLRWIFLSPAGLVKPLLRKTMRRTQ